MPRITLVFVLSSSCAQADIVRELSHHDGVDATHVEVDGSPAVKVEMPDAVPLIWEVRAAIAMFDEDAREQRGQG